MILRESAERRCAEELLKQYGLENIVEPEIMSLVSALVVEKIHDVKKINEFPDFAIELPPPAPPLRNTKWRLIKYFSTFEAGETHDLI